MKLNGVMKALVWLGLGGGIGFFAGYQVGYKRKEKDIREEADEAIRECTERFRDQCDQWVAQIKEDAIRQNKAEIAELRRQYEDALDAQREYLGGKDDEIISEGQVEMDLEEDPEEDVDVMDEVPEMPEDIDVIEAEPFHPEVIRPFAISASEYRQNAHGYDTVELDYYTEDCVIFDPLREEKWTHPEQLLGLGWKAMFISSGKPVTEAYVQNDTMEILYKITRIEDSFERLYEEE